MNWSIKDVRGSRDAVKTKLQAEKELPADVKAFLCSQVDALSADVSGCRVDAYCQDVKSTLAVTSVTRNMNITIVGVTL